MFLLFLMCRLKLFSVINLFCISKGSQFEDIMFRLGLLFLKLLLKFLDQQVEKPMLWVLIRSASLRHF